MDDVELWQGDCLDLMGRIPAGTVDMVLADLPYGTTRCAWDSIIPLEPLWAHYKRILKPGGAIVLTAAQPFTTTLIASNMRWFKYADVWDKRMPVGHLNAKKMPLRRHEDLVVFSPAKIGSFTYNPQMEIGALVRKGGRGRQHQGPYGNHDNRTPHTSNLYYPTSIIAPPKEPQGSKVHPTQKPVSLGEYLILTYSNPGETVLDNTIGSGSFGVAAVNSGRRFIGIEKDPGHFATAEHRITEAVQAKSQNESRPTTAQGRLF